MPVTIEPLGQGVRVLRAGTRGGTPRLLLLPYAGGTSGAARALFAALPETWELLAVDPPGCGLNRGAALEDAQRMAGLYLELLGGELDSRTAIYGHSLGGLVAYLMTRALEADGRALAAVVIAALRGPRRVVDELWAELPDADFVARIDAIDGVPAALAREPELLRSFLPSIRAGFRALERYVHRPAPPITTPLLAIGGADDPYVAISRAEEWLGFGTRARFITVPGRHFFLESHPEPLAQVLVDTLPP